MKKIALLLSGFVLMAIFTRCAKMGSLTGGPRDEDPPEVIESTPENYSVNFSGDKIEITFNEYIQLDDINQELVISPPLENQPDVRLRNKSILIELENELRPNTTYTLNFGRAIKDNNEGNPLTNYEFVFSTGEFLDSLSVGGNLLNAFDLKAPEDPVTVMLYDDLSDSIVFKDIPVYIGKTNEDGTYRINNLKADTFKLFALQDMNNNFLFDLPNEPIAFLDTSIIVDAEFFSRVVVSEPDTLQSDQLPPDSIPTERKKTEDPVRQNQATKSGTNEGMETLADEQKTGLWDSTVKQNDSLSDGLSLSVKTILVDLFLFTEKSEIQFLSDYNRKRRELLDFTFSLPVTDSFAFRSLIPPAEDWYLKVENARRDSFQLWIVDEEILQLDTLMMEFRYTVSDSTQRKISKTDTLIFSYRTPSQRKKKTENQEGEAEQKKLNIQTVANKTTLELNQRVKFSSLTPLKEADTSYVDLYIVEDSLEVAEPFNIVRDTTNVLNYIFEKSWASGAHYRFTALPGAFTDVYGAVNDSIEANFSVREDDYYGTLLVEIDTVKSPLLIQLTDLKDVVKREIFIEKKSEVRFPYLKAAKYKIKLIYDENGNEEWDTGKYIKSIQPEKIQFYPEEIEVRANWEMLIKMKYEP